MMKWVAIFLVVVNVLIFGWSKLAPPPDVDQGKDEAPDAINLQNMMLANELEPAKLQKSEVVDETVLVGVDAQSGVVNLPEDGLKPGKATSVIIPINEPKKKPVARNRAPFQPKMKLELESVASVADSSVASLPMATEVPAPESGQSQSEVFNCYRVGPYPVDASLKIQALLDQHQAQYQREVVASTSKSGATRVSVGPIKDHASLIAQTNRLKALGVKYFVIGPSGSESIQLGYYKDRANAASFQARMKSKGFESSLKTELLGKPEMHWYALKLDAEQGNYIRKKQLKTVTGVSIIDKSCAQ